MPTTMLPTFALTTTADVRTAKHVHQQSMGPAISSGPPKLEHNVAEWLGKPSNGCIPPPPGEPAELPIKLMVPKSKARPTPPLAAKEHLADASNTAKDNLADDVRTINKRLMESTITDRTLEENDFRRLAIKAFGQRKSVAVRPQEIRSAPQDLLHHPEPRDSGVRERTVTANHIRSYSWPNVKIVTMGWAPESLKAMMIRT